MRIKNVLFIIVAMLFTTVSFAAERSCYTVEMELGVGGDPTIVWVTTTPVTGKMTAVSCMFEDIAVDLRKQGYTVIRKPAKVVNGKVVK